MATKYMGAKMLQKQIEKDKAKKARLKGRTKGGIFSNTGETIGRKKSKQF